MSKKLEMLEPALFCETSQQKKSIKINIFINYTGLLKDTRHLGRSQASIDK